MKIIFTLVLFLMLTVCWAQIVINEVMVDPIGSDTGKEWIELYNPIDQPVNVTGWKIKSAGTSFTLNYTIPQFIMEPYSFLLIGEDSVSFANFNTDLNFQNGGNASDGIRIENPSQSYYDTLIYDSPNVNNLPDDIHNPAINFVENLISGYSIARKIDGVDSNSESDWQINSVLTPGFSNNDFVDFSITEIYINTSENDIEIHTIIHNLSTCPVAGISICVEILIDNICYDLQPIMPFDADNNSHLYTNFQNLSTGIHKLEISVQSNEDVNINNNSKIKYFLIGNYPLILNEVMHSPNTGLPEWVEFYNASDSLIHLQNAFIIDQSGTQAYFDISIGPEEFRVITSNPSLLQENYPFLDDNIVIQTTGWCALNNNGDSIVFYPFSDIPADSLSYLENSTPKGVSLERFNIDNNVQWLPSSSPYGASPGQTNLLCNQDSSLLIQSWEISQENNLLTHQLNILNSIEINQIEVTFKEKIDNEEWIILNQYSIDLQNELTIDFQSQLHENTYTIYLIEISYLLNNETKLIQRKNSFINNSFPIAVNEIMYNPLVNEPEWIEIKRNNNYEESMLYNVIISNDSLLINVSDKEYIIITASKADSIWLSAHYNLEDTTIFYGFINLSNSGEEIRIKDVYNQLIESFIYNPDWSKTKGNSIERISSLSTANNDLNWTSSRTVHTIGKENSVFYEPQLSEHRFSILPKVFSPYRNEYTSISCYIPGSTVNLKIKIFNLKGALIRELLNASFINGHYVCIWDGKNEQQQNMIPGIYPVYIEAYDESGKTYKKIDKIILGY